MIEDSIISGLFTLAEIKVLNNKQLQSAEKILGNDNIRQTQASDKGDKLVHSASLISSRYISLGM